MPDQEQIPHPQNGTLFQGFEWNVPADGQHWKRLTAQIPKLAHIGITAMWLPPGCKAASPEGNGYDIYDLYDLGEFNQKGSVRTKWGTKDELLELSKVAKEHNVALYWDAVLNHKAGADRKERCRIVEVDTQDRTKEISSDYEIDAWLGFDFEGRGDKYSSQKYHWEHFTGTDYNAENEQTGIFKILGENKGWSRTVDKEQGNADYMMFADIDYSHAEVIEDVKNWGAWIVKEVGLKGFRLDAVQHFSQRFSNEWVEKLNSEFGKNEIFYVGEFWVGETKTLTDWLADMDHKFSLFDAPLLYNFARISTSTDADLRKVFDDSLTAVEPQSAVTVVMNHDTQPGQTVATHIEGWFKPLAYALILLRQEGYPCPFYGDLYGMKGENPEEASCGHKLADLILARKLYAYGEQEDYFEEQTCIGFVRRGTWDHRWGCAVVMSNDKEAQRKMSVGKMHAGEVWTDVLGWQTDEVTIDEEGWGVFPVPGISVSVWVNREAEGRDQFPVNFDENIYGNSS